MTEPPPSSNDWQDFYKNPPPPPPPPVKSPVSKGRIVLTVIVMLFVVFVGRHILAWAFTPTVPEADTRAERPPAAIPVEVLERFFPSPTPTAPATPARKLTVVTPDKLGGRAKTTDPQLTKVASDTATRLNVIPKTTTTIVAAYGSHEKKTLMLMLALATTSGSSGFDFLLNDAFDGSEVIKQPTDFDAGPLGGKAKCGEGRRSGVTYTVCTWMDEGTIGEFIWFYSGQQKAQTEFHALRAAVEQVG